MAHTGSWREWLIGPPLPTQRMAHEKLDKIRALAAFSPDALSSIAYANQEIFLGLALMGAAGLNFMWPIGIVIAVLLGILALSYAQTITAYPSGGGSYIVAHENLGELPGLIAAGALMIDYVLVAAVSLTAGVAELASAFPVLWDFRVPVALILLVMVALANMRGVRESGTIMSVPVYFFLAAYLGMLAWGMLRAVQEGPTPFEQTAPPGVELLSLPLLLHAFASGCTALTGIEAISNGVPAFRPPESKNANKTMLAMAILMGLLFLGSTGLTQYFGVVTGPEETILSALARRILGGGILHAVVQIAVLSVLVIAANTSFADFPRVTSILARDGYVPRQLSFLGDRLVYANGMMLLAGLAALLIVLFRGDTHALVPLFAVGAFLAFTLSQMGMVVHWIRLKGPNWRLKALANGLGAIATTTTLLVIAISKFSTGAWIVVILIPMLVLGFRSVKHHYNAVREQLTVHHGLPPDLRALPHPRVVVPVAGVHRGTIAALRYACSISNQVTAVFIELEPGSAQNMRNLWHRWGLHDFATLEIVPSPYRSIVAPFLEFLDRTDLEHNDGTLASVLLPEFVPAHWWESFLHNQTAWMIKLALLYRRRTHAGRVRAIIDVPLYLRD